VKGPPNPILYARGVGETLSLAFSPAVVRRALGYAVVVGAILVGINHGDALLRGELDANRVLKLILTPLVPYVVSTLSSVSALRSAGSAGGPASRPPLDTGA